MTQTITHTGWTQDTHADIPPPTDPKSVPDWGVQPHSLAPWRPLSVPAPPPRHAEYAAILSPQLWAGWNLQLLADHYVASPSWECGQEGAGHLGLIKGRLVAGRWLAVVRLSCRRWEFFCWL